LKTSKRAPSKLTPRRSWKFSTKSRTEKAENRKLGDKGSTRPHYGYYGLPILTIVSASILAIGIAAAALSWWFAGLALIVFGLYLIITYGFSRLLTNQHAASELPAIVEIRGDEKVLDVGCGLGKLTNGVAKALRGGKVIGIDVWNKMKIRGSSPERAYENAKIEGVGDRVEFRYGNVLDIPFTNNYFDIVTARSVLNNVHGDINKSRALAEIRRVLQPRGRFLMLEPLRDLRGFIAFSPLAFWILLTRDKWVRLLKEAGFINIGYTYEKGLGIFLVEKPG